MVINLLVHVPFVHREINRLIASNNFVLFVTKKNILRIIEVEYVLILCMFYKYVTNIKASVV